MQVIDCCREVIFSLDPTLHEGESALLVNGPGFQHLETYLLGLELDPTNSLCLQCRLLTVHVDLLYFHDST